MKDANMEAINERIRQFRDSLSLENAPRPGSPLWAGVDLGTANIVTAVVDQDGTPVAGMTTRSKSTVRDGLVFDYMGVMSILKTHVQVLRSRGFDIKDAAAAYPPGTMGRNRQAFGHILNGADLEAVSLVDEPSAAALALGIDSGCVVDIGGGTTGISILEDGEVVYTGDEPTGGHHLDLVIAGSMGISIEEAEAMKNNPAHQRMLAGMVMPVFEKMGAIVREHTASHKPKQIYLVGGTSSFPGADEVIAQETGLPVFLPDDPLLVTPLGTALHAALAASGRKAAANE
ncbi:ethanolamine utilization protein EutJ [Desulfatibacillum aliphaticivorans]|uniref:ethanolamine utilization protein EutJ n=1 Tax=Desulfatibacillum aliphaticivorans TaxID=218208 RepID=UPI0004205D7F|nr:ethanolamine utilization protein EutJ [Desulfatibacillum aliphaticivorans]